MINQSNYDFGGAIDDIWQKMVILLSLTLKQHLKITLIV